MSDCGCTTTTQATANTGSYVQLSEAAINDTPCTPVPEGLLIETCDTTTGSSSTTGASAAQFLNAAPVTEMTLLGRVGNTLARFVGSGFLQIRNGKAAVVSALPLKISRLLHRWVSSETTSKAVIGDPEPYPFKVAAINSGEAVGIQGLHGEDSIEVWNHETRNFEQRSLALPMAYKGSVPKKCDGIELIGFPKIDECESVARGIKALTGSGFIVLDQAAKLEGCCEDEGCSEPSDLAPAYARTVSFPEGQSNYYVRVQNGLIHFEQKDSLLDGASAYEIAVANGFVGTETAWLASLQGQDGADGVNGADGADGDSAYDAWLALGNVGTVQDFIDSLAGADGADGADGQNFSGSLSTETETLEVSSVFQAQVTAAGNLNATGQVPLSAAARADSGWSNTAGTGVFVVSNGGTGTIDRVALDINIEVTGTADSIVSVNLYKNGSPVAGAIATVNNTLGSGKASFQISYVDVAPGATATYSLVCDQEGTDTTAVPVTRGTVTGVAYLEQAVVTEASLVEE